MRFAVGRDHWISPTISVDRLRLGEDDGDWVVAVNALSPESVIYSVGLGNNISFDLDLVRRFGCKVFGFDPTPFALNYLSTINLPKQITVYQLGLATFDGTKAFGEPDENVSFSSHIVSKQKLYDVRKLSTLMQMLSHTRVDLLKIDIEGDEYEVLDQMLSEHILPTQLLVEFHHGIYGISIAKTQQYVERLETVGYQIFDVSPVGREFSFLHCADPVVGTIRG